MDAFDEQRSAGGARRAVQPGALSALLREVAATPSPEVAWEEHIAPGAVIGRFEIVRELGRGGFGVVYEARDKELGRSVAFKAVRPGRSGPGGAQLLREAESIARLSHPNLVTLFDAGRCSHGPYLVLELLRGVTLERRLAQGPIAPGEAIRIATEVARGLAHAHAEGVVHRDLKPSNVFLCERGPAKLLDFGMAHAFGRQRVSGGTPAYMAPEQWRRAPEDERTDVFALGVMLHRMLSGALPYGEGGCGETGRRAPELEVPDAPGLGELVRRMLERDPVDRPRDGGEVLAVLEPLLRELDRTPSSGSRGPVRRRRSLVRIAALVAAGALAGGTGAAIALHRAARSPTSAERTPSIAVLPFASLSSSTDDRFFAEGIHGELITQLGKMSALRVIARSSVQRYRDGPRDLRAIAATLGVGTILEGTVQRSGDRVRIAAQLVDPRTGAQLWGDRFDRDLSDVFAIQTEVALEIARALGARLTPSERRLVERAPTRDREAHELFLRGLYYWERSIGVESDNRMADELIAKAVARDPAFALAHAWLAVVRAEWKGDCGSAREHAERAIALEPDLPQAHAALGTLGYECDRDAPAAIRELEVAVRGAPGDAGSRALLGSMRTLVGRFDEGLADLQEALALDPRSYLVSVELAKELSIVRRFDEASRACERAREISPGDVHALVLCALMPLWRNGDLGPGRRVFDVLPAELPTSGNGAWSLFQLLAFFPERALALAGAGRLQDPFSGYPFIPRAYVLGTAHAALGHAHAARAAFAASVPPLEAHVAEAQGDPLRRLFLARAYAGVGRVEDAMRETRRARELARDEERQGSALRFAAEIAAAAGRRDEAIEALRAILHRRDGLVTAASVRVDPRFAPLRGDPAFEALVAMPAR